MKNKGKMKNPRKKFLRVLLVFFTFLIILIPEARSQYYLIGTDPASVKWSQIKTPHFKVIYPNSWKDKAQYVANGLEYVYEPGSRSISQNTQKTPVIIHSQTTVPSSVTYIAPRRMEYFTAPPQDLFPQDWVDQLIIHEFRHAVQYSAINKGFTKGLSYVLGEQGVFGMYGLLLPLWFIEGDATVAETALHNTGRGRTPTFEMRLRAQFVEKGIYSYEKANYGSYRDFVPNKYELGYQLVGIAKVKYGPDLWRNVISNVGRRPYTLVPFSSEIKRQTGFNKYNLYDTITRELQKTWIAEDKTKKENEYQILSPPKENFYVNYNLPAVLRNNSILALKSSREDIPKVVLINKDLIEKDLFKVGINFYSESLSSGDSIIYWSELISDPRWLLRDYRVIKTYNLSTGKTKQLTHLSRYYAPAVSQDGKYLAAVEVSPENMYSLVILNSRDGSLIRKISTPDNLLFVHPRWSEDGKSVVSVVFGKEGNSLAVTNTESGNTEVLLPASSFEMKRPSFWRNYIIYTASYNGADNIYAFDRNMKSVSAITSARFGASEASVTKDLSAIVYSNYTADGYIIAEETLDTTKWRKISIPSKSAFPLAESLTRQENFIYNADSVPKINYESKPYSKLLNLFNFHSWAPLGLDLQNFSPVPGATLISQNLLGTTVTGTGYLYNTNEKTGNFYFSLNNESLYPAIDLRLDYGGRKNMGIYTRNDSVMEKWHELTLYAGLRLPLNWTHNNWTRSFLPAIGMSYKYLKMNESIPIEFDHPRIVALNYSLIASNEIKTAQRDIYPRWSQELQINYNNTPFNGSTNSLLAGQLTMDFPGLFRHHGLQLYGSYQKKIQDTYPFSDIIFFPKGYSNISRKEIFSFSAMYSMPLFYPEWQIGQLMYFKRIKTSVFYDYARSTDPLLPKHFSTIGFDLTSDFSLFNLIAPLDAGIRSMYNPESGDIKFGLIFSLNFGAMY